ncbi:MAG: DUF111 family protein [Spirochaetales bacterium]|nr:DUF111 family protein [Spirochaetales bacterium]
MSLLVIDPVSGMAGDMFCAALLDLGVEKKTMLAVMRQVAERLGGVNISSQEETRLDIKGTRLVCEYANQDSSADSAVLGDTLNKAYTEHGIQGDYKEYAERAFSILKQAEQAAHAQMRGHVSHKKAGQVADKKTNGSDPRNTSDHHPIHLHEAQDIIVDIIGSAWALQQLGVRLARVCCVAPVSIGGGEISFSHGSFPVPAPATAEIVGRYGIPATSGPVERELLTPTGAALLAALGPTYIERAERSPAFPRSVQSGVGFGSTFVKSKGKTSVNALFVFLMDEEDG